MELNKELYTVKEAAAYFGVTKATIYDWMKNRGMSWVWLGGRRRITRATLESWVKPGGDESSKEAYNPKDQRTPMSATA